MKKVILMDGAKRLEGGFTYQCRRSNILLAIEQRNFIGCPCHALFMENLENLEIKPDK